MDADKVKDTARTLRQLPHLELVVTTLAGIMASEIMDEAYGYAMEENPAFDYQIEMAGEHEVLERSICKALRRIHEVDDTVLAKIWHRRLEGAVLIND